MGPRECTPETDMHGRRIEKRGLQQCQFSFSFRSINALFKGGPYCNVNLALSLEPRMSLTND
jgi:hypothetical protein